MYYCFNKLPEVDVLRVLSHASKHARAKYANSLAVGSSGCFASTFGAELVGVAGAEVPAASSFASIFRRRGDPARNPDRCLVSWARNEAATDPGASCSCKQCNVMSTKDTVPPPSTPARSRSLLGLMTCCVCVCVRAHAAWLDDVLCVCVRAHARVYVCVQHL